MEGTVKAAVRKGLYIAFSGGGVNTSHLLLQILAAGFGSGLAKEKALAGHWGERRTVRLDSCFPWLFLCEVTRGRSVPPLESTVPCQGSYSRHPFLVLPLPPDTPPLILVSCF